MATDAIKVSLKTNAIAFVLMIVFGTPFAYVLGRSRFRGRSVRDHARRAAVGAAAGRRGDRTAGGVRAAGAARAGRSSTLGIANPVFRQGAVVMCILFVAGPFYLRGAIAAFEAVDGTLARCRRHSGRRLAAPIDCASRCRSPAADSVRPPAVAFARGVGEFGATILFAGSFQGTTQTLPLAVYFDFSGDNIDAGGRDRRAAARASALRSCSASKLLGAAYGRLDIDITLPRRAFDVRAALSVGAGTGRARRTVGARQGALLRTIAGDRAPSAPDADLSRRRALVSTPGGAST